MSDKVLPFHALEKSIVVYHGGSEPQTMTVPQAARMLGVSRASLDKLVLQAKQGEKRTMVERPGNELPQRERPDRNPEERRDWETLQKNENDVTQRLRVAGGWLYRTIVTGVEGNGVALVFVDEHGSDTEV